MIAKNILLACSVCFILLIICGCATFTQTGADTLHLSVERYRSLAIAYEKDQQLYKAVFMWFVVQKLNFDDSQASQRIAALEERIRHGADQHFLKGMEYNKQKSYLAARIEFLKTLAYDPNQKDVLELLKHDEVADGYIIYKTKQGDTTRKVAQKIYLDSGKDFIVAYFSGLSDDDYLKPGTVLKLPVIEWQLFQLEHKKKHIPRPAMPRVQRVNDKAGAEDHYHKGISFFLAEDMQRAIREWEETLSLDPDHPNAMRNIEKARNLLRKGQLK